MTLAGLLQEELIELLKSYPAYRARQVYEWICRGAMSFKEMSNLPASLREQLSENYVPVAGLPVTELSDPDGTVKLALELDDGNRIESVILSDGKGRKTSCLSSQIGCPMACVFCKTGTLGLKRNLSSQEIAGQFLHLRKIAPEITHIVIMGMGEPLLNLGELRKALLYFMEEGGLNISKRRITISTCGIEKGIIDLTEQGPDVRLALSLNSARQDIRERLMPGVKDSLAAIKNQLLRYQKKHRITLEMVLLKGINTGTIEADAIKDYCQGLNVVINLIPWNPVQGLEFEGVPLEPPGKGEVANFASELENRALKVTQRLGKGCSIAGACGQLGIK